MLEERVGRSASDEADVAGSDIDQGFEAELLVVAEAASVAQEFGFGCGERVGGFFGAEIAETSAQGDGVGGSEIEVLEADAQTVFLAEALHDILHGVAGAIEGAGEKGFERRRAGLGLGRGSGGLDLDVDHPGGCASLQDGFEGGGFGFGARNELDGWRRVRAGVAAQKAGQLERIERLAAD